MTRRANTVLKGYNEVGRLTLPNFKTHNKLQESRQCGIGAQVNKQINGTV